MTVCLREEVRELVEVPESPFPADREVLGFRHGDWVRCSFGGSVTLAQVDFTLRSGRQYVENQRFVPLRQRVLLREGRGVTPGSGGFSPDQLQLVCRPSDPEQHR